MPTFSDGLELDEPIPNDAKTLTSAGSMRQHLQLLLEGKEKQLQQAGTLGQRVLAQQMELEERVRQLQEIDGDKDEDEDVSSEMRRRYRDLANTLKAWEEENVQLSTAFASKYQTNGTSPSVPYDELPQELPSHGASAPSAAQSRRAKNAAHRANDVEFAFEIGSSLLTEVRRLQSLLGERDKAIQDMKEEKDDLEKAVESLRTALGTQEQSADKYKEENWNLEVTLQELRTQLQEAQAAALRGEAESKRLTKLLAGSRESNDNHKNEVERLKTTLEEVKAKHETDVAHHRKQTAALARDKSDLQQAFDSYKAEVARAGRRLPRFGSPMTPLTASEAMTPNPNEEDDDPFSAPGTSLRSRRIDTSSLFPPDAFGGESGESSPEPSPSRPFLAPNHPSNEIEALQQKLAHAQRQLSTLKGTLAREKETRIDYQRRLAEAGIDADHDEDEEEQEEEVVEEDGASKKGWNATLRGRGGRGGGRSWSGMSRGGSRTTLAHKLGMAALNPSSDYEDEEEEDSIMDSTSPPDLQVPDNSVQMSNSTSTQSPTPTFMSNRTSVDGMDPEFANVLRPINSTSTLGQNSSPPFPKRPSARGGRGGLVGRRRGGTAFQEPRPSSLVGQPEALAAELGIGMESVAEDAPAEKETAEFGCQAEFVEPLPPPVVITHDTSEAGVQVEPEPEPIPAPLPVPVPVHVEPTPAPPVILKADFSLQTDAPPHVELVEMGIETDPEPEAPPVVVPVRMDNSTHTEQHILVPTHEVEVQTPRAQMLEVDTQTPKPPVAITVEIEVQTDVEKPPVQEIVRPVTPLRSEAETQTTPTRAAFDAGTPRASAVASEGVYPRLRYLSSASTVTGLPPRLSINQALEHHDYSDDELDAQTEILGETEPETETDIDDYHDARSVAPTPSATESIQEDFHSISTMTDNEYSEDEMDEMDDVDDMEDTDDVESIKASYRMSQGSSMMHTEESAGAPSIPPVTYESQAVGTDPEPESAPVPEKEKVEEPKRELAEMSIQTDEWKPPVTPVEPSARPSFGLYRVGPSNQQFQFITPVPSSSAGASTVPTTPVSSPTASTSIRDSSATISAIRPSRFSSLTSEAERRQSIETTLEGAQEHVRQHTQSFGPSMSPTVDKTRPPTMMLPPPPRIPPPPNSMPPPPFIPEKRRPTSALSNHRDMPPPRPSSPPPPELIHRATTPTFGSVLVVPGQRGFPQRQHGASLPPMGTGFGLRQPSSTTSFRSANDRDMSSVGGFSAAALLDNSRNRNLRSATSLLSDHEEVGSRRSSISSDFHPSGSIRGMAMPEPEPHAANTTVNGTATAGDRTMMSNGGATDPAIIHAITQTMIGEFLYKYTRRTIGKGHGERRHKRFFWVHPYTRTLYWSSADPGSTNVTESNAKSAYIDSVRSVLDPNPMPPGLHQYSVIISTPQREMKVTAPTKERHDIWLNALQFLLARPPPATTNPAPPNGHPVTPSRNPHSMPKPVVSSPFGSRTARSEQSGMGDSPWNVTPRGQRSRSQMSVRSSMGKRSGTPAAEYLRWMDETGSPGGRNLTHEFEQVAPGADEDDEDLDFEIHDDIIDDTERYEGLENVRACCDGMHSVGRLGIEPHHHHHVQGQDSLHPSRPASPAFSFRSRASSTKSRDREGGTGSLFSRFGTRRSARTPQDQ